MTEHYTVSYAADALNDLREIYAYLSNELLVPKTAAALAERIRRQVRSLDSMPARFALVDWEPWHSMKMHQFSVNNFVVYYLIDDGKRSVIVARIFYGGRNVEEIVHGRGH